MINAYAAFEAGEELKPYSYDPGELAANEVEIDVLYCGICHSDLSVIDSEWGPASYPVVPGHEIVGKVSQVGAAAMGIEPGQTVGLGWHSGYCDTCDYCGSGDHNLCQRAQPTIIGHHGGFADKVRASSSSVVPIPDGINLESLGPMFCGGITVYNPIVQYQIKPTDRIGVIGIGGLGHIALKFLNAWGCDVTAFTSNDSKRDELLELGAHHVLNSREPGSLKAAKNRFDFIISTVNVSLDWNAYLATLKPKGRLHFVGVALEPLDIGATSLMSKQLAVSASPVGSPSTMRGMLEFAQRHSIEPQVEVYAMTDVNKAVARLRSGDARYRVVLSRV